MRKITAFPARAVLVFLLVAAFAGSALAQRKSAKPAPPPATMPGFAVNVTYSQKARATLTAAKETVIVVGYLYGFPRPGAPNRYVDEIGQVDLGEVKREIAPGAAATFESVAPGQALLKWLDGQGLQLLINVYSGRKSSPNNLLDCDLYEGPLKEAQGKTLPIACKLIGE